ncbi:MAG: Fe-only nitrogenase accessory AnfO family protein [Clostridiales bacterium]|nr:hypothetical protein [Eubacteriales bacterium]MDH7567239.1 Fe-only nitrogenase accessory AnfO family protein [Clostridiales bacterium]
MSRDIAVIVGNDGQTASFFEPGIIRVYSKKNGECEQIREAALHIELRRKAAEPWLRSLS